MGGEVRGKLINFRCYNTRRRLFSTRTLEVEGPRNWPGSGWMGGEVRGKLINFFQMLQHETAALLDKDTGSGRTQELAGKWEDGR